MVLYYIIYKYNKYIPKGFEKKKNNNKLYIHTKIDIIKIKKKIN
jgi:hypothetical protein